MRLMISFGFADIFVFDDTIEVNYGGNMGNNINDVAEIVDKLFGEGTFEEMRAVASREEGHPNYSWYMVVPRDKFDFTAEQRTKLNWHDLDALQEEIDLEDQLVKEARKVRQLDVKADLKQLVASLREDKKNLQAKVDHLEAIRVAAVNVTECMSSQVPTYLEELEHALVRYEVSKKASDE